MKDKNYFGLVQTPKCNKVINLRKQIALYFYGVFIKLQEDK